MCIKLLRVNGRQLQHWRYRQGFTLLEILIALFIFTMIAMMLGSALRTVINIHQGVSATALRLRDLQMALILLSRDVEQAANRPVLDEKGTETLAFVGDPRSFTFTHLGYGGSMIEAGRSDMQRTRYHWEGTTLWRTTWQALDQPPEAKPQLRPILENVEGARFQYLDKSGKAHAQWTVAGKEGEILPRAVSVNLKIAGWGEITQLYVIPAEANKQVDVSAET